MEEKKNKQMIRNKKKDIMDQIEINNFKNAL